MLGLDQIVAENNRHQAEYVLRQFQRHAQQEGRRVVVDMLGHRIYTMPTEFLVILGNFVNPIDAIRQGVAMPFNERFVTVAGSNGADVDLIFFTDNVDVASRLCERYNRPRFWTREGAPITVSNWS